MDFEADRQGMIEKQAMLEESLGKMVQTQVEKEAHKVQSLFQEMLKQNEEMLVKLQIKSGKIDDQAISDLRRKAQDEWV